MINKNEIFTLMRWSEKNKKFVRASRGTIEHLKTKIKGDEYYRLFDSKGRIIRVEAIGGVQAFIRWKKW